MQNLNCKNLLIKFKLPIKWKFVSLINMHNMGNLRTKLCIFQIFKIFGGNNSNSNGQYAHRLTRNLCTIYGQFESDASNLSRNFDTRLQFIFTNVGNQLKTSCIQLKCLGALIKVLDVLTILSQATLLKYWRKRLINLLFLHKMIKKEQKNNLQN
jgi:hypothetical protein